VFPNGTHIDKSQLVFYTVSKDDSYSGPTTADPTFVYNMDTGMLYWDANGNKAGGITNIAVLLKQDLNGDSVLEVTPLAHTDIWIVE